MQIAVAASVDFTNPNFTVTPPTTNTTAFLPNRNWQTYCEGVYKIAANRGCAVVNIGADNGSTPYAKGYSNGYDVHPTIAGHVRYAYWPGKILNPP